jgi:hypothetical protein
VAGAISAEVVGIRALTKDLLKLADDHSGTLLPYLQEAAMAAMQPGAEAVRGALPSVSGRLRGSVRVRRNRTGATVIEGGEGVLYAGPVDFGGYPESRPYLPNGRYLFPQMERVTARAESIYTKAVQQALDRIQWTNETTNAGAIHD